ncbi:protein Daple [Anguilla anguilla]|uniref:protein Daple n=1 Tax=Anguilla anguilla TaxID=7936 RepID=UPI0015B33A14|nr:protein Daple [Anguilla anguilla]
MDVTVSELMANFLDSPLVVWVKTLGPLGNGSEDKLSVFMDLVDGVFLHKIMTQIDPSPTNQRVNKHVNNDLNLRAQNLKIIIRHIKNYYQENLQQLVVMNLPNALSISKDPLSAKGMEEMNRLLLLMLGCAVQCDRKEEFIEKIKLLDIETQAAIVTHIQEVTQNQENVLDLQWLELADLPAEELDPLSRSMALHLRRLIDERDDCVEAILELTQERDYLQSQQPAAPPLNSAPERPLLRGGSVPILGKEERQHLSVELADSKARLRRSRQELEEKTEQLMDAKNEIERQDLELQKLKQEGMQLLAEARSARVYRDELDALRERAGRVDRLETELTRCKERLHDVHFYKTRVEELREDNLTLMETKALLEEQLSGARGRCDKLHELEKENLQLRSKLHDVEMERDVDKKRLEELMEENMMLEVSQKQSMNESAHLGWELEQLAKSNDSGEARKSFVFELNESALSRLLKLEKENQGLQSRVEELREASLNLDQAQLRTQELEKENNQLNEKMEKLQVLLEQEKQATHDMGNLGEELLKDKQKLEKALEAAQAEKDRQAQELEHLNQAVASLRKRAQEDSEARVREVEAENRALHQTISDARGRLAQAEAEARRAAEDLERALERAERAGGLEEEVARLEGAREELQKQAAALPAARQRAEALERENGGLEQDNRRLKKRADAAQNAALRLGALEEERRQLEAENLELRRAAKQLRPAAARLPQAEAERAELERERDALARAADELRPLAKKAERLELSCAALDAENRRLQGCLEGGRAQAQGLERELREAGAEAQRLRREAEEELRPAARRLEEAEAERRSLEQEAGQAEKERKQAEKEARRLRQQLEAKEAALDESAARVAGLEKENGALGKEVARLREAAGRVKELERESKELQKQATIDKRTLATLREDLVSEKLKVQQQWNDLEKLSHELEKIGLNREKLLQEEHSCEDNKYKILESKIDSTMKKTLQIREEKIQGLESRLEESGNLNKQLHAELTTVKRSLEALKQRQEEQEAHSNHTQQAQLRPPPEKGEREATAELLKLKDRLIDIEKNNAALQTEKQLHREQLRQLDTQNTQLNAQILTLQRQATALQEHNTALHTQAAKLQVENATLNSQSASLMAQNATLQGQVQTLEGEAEALEGRFEEARAGRESVLQDHERLLAVHERQAAEYEQLIAQHTALKGSHRGLEQEHRALENKYAMLLMQKTALEELEGTLQRERESLGEEIHKNGLILAENQSLRGEVDRVTQAHEQLTQECDRLQLQTKELKTSLNESQLELNRWQARYDQLKEQHQGLDLSLTKLDNHCELLTRLKGNLEEENHHLLSQIQILSQQNQTLLERTMESKELYHEEQKQYIDKLNALRRQKEKLEEKIMDQYKFYDPAPKKRNHWVGAKALAKFIKPKKESSRERVRSAPETSRPTSPTDGLDGPLPPPPPPPRQPRLSVDSAEESQSLTISPAYTSKGRSETTGSRGRDATRLPGGGGGGETPNGPEEPLARRRASELGVPAYSTPTNATSTPGHAPNSSSRHGHRPRGLSCDEDLRLQSPDATFGSSVHGNAGHRLSSAEFSRSASSSDSPVHSKDSLERLDALALGHGPRDSLLSRASPLPSETPPPRTGPRLARRRPSSPGSEMVTLEEFLQESNTLSPPTVQTGSREDLMTDYFSKVGEWPSTGRPTPLRDGAKTPTSYVTPTVKATPPGDPRALKPGQTVKPSVRQPEAATPPCHSQTLPNRPASGGRALPQHHSGGPLRGTKGGLSRTFSLASADLLRSNGPDSYRQEGGGGGARPGGDEGREDAGVARRAGAGPRERPQSAILAGSLHPLQPGDSGHGRLSLVPPKDEHLLPPPQHHSSSLSLSSSPTPTPRDRYGVRRTGTPLHHRGEVAMVTPVRAVPALRQDDREETPEAPPAESPLAKKWEGGGGGGGNCSMEEHPKSTPASPDPNNDPQTVWYEYGCV